MTSATSTISSRTHIPFSKSNISPQKSSLSHISFTTHFPKSAFSLKKNNSKSMKFSPIQASAATASSDDIYVNTRSLYGTLGVSETGTLSEIKKAYKKLVRKYHPDVSPAGKTEEYTKRFIQVQEAYETLSDPERRTLYDKNKSRGGLGLHTIFSAGKRRSNSYRENGFVDLWEQRWQSQLEELIKRSNNRDDSKKMSWGAKMRKQNSFCN